MRIATLLAISSLLLLPARAANILVFPFESNDVTLFPQIEEIERARRVAKGLNRYFSNHTTANLSVISDKEFDTLNKGVNYLYNKPPLVAEIATENGPNDWAVVGRLYRPSHLFAYIQAKLVRVSNGTVREFLSVEIKGSADEMMVRGVERLAQQIEAIVLKP